MTTTTKSTTRRAGVSATGLDTSALVITHCDQCGIEMDASLRECMEAAPIYCSLACEELARDEATEEDEERERAQRLEEATK